ncbi:MAG: DUF503 domain-containing protein [Negativicutes bacterium]
MSAVVCEIELLIPGAASLKGKRHVVKSIIGRIKARCNASVAETDFQDNWQRAVITAAMAGADRFILQKQIEIIRQIVYDNSEAELVDITAEYL